jgi:hypothetical protein
MEGGYLQRKRNPPQSRANSLAHFSQPVGTIHESRRQTGTWRALGSYSTIASCGVKLMTCKSCSSENQRRFSSEIIIHFSGLKNLDKPAVFVFPKLLICLECGFTEFDLPETELHQIGEGAGAHGTASCPTHGWSFDLSEVAAGLPFRSREIETREPAADKPLTLKNTFYRQ